MGSNRLASSAYDEPGLSWLLFAVSRVSRVRQVQTSGCSSYLDLDEGLTSSPRSRACGLEAGRHENAQNRHIIIPPGPVEVARLVRSVVHNAHCTLHTTHTAQHIHDCWTGGLCATVCDHASRLAVTAPRRQVILQDHADDVLTAASGCHMRYTALYRDRPAPAVSMDGWMGILTWALGSDGVRDPVCAWHGS
jgi:hypothetical protein